MQVLVSNGVSRNVLLIVVCRLNTFGSDLVGTWIFLLRRSRELIYCLPELIDAADLFILHKPTNSLLGSENHGPPKQKKKKGIMLSLMQRHLRCAEVASPALNASSTGCCVGCRSGCTECEYIRPLLHHPLLTIANNLIKQMPSQARFNSMSHHLWDRP